MTRFGKVAVLMGGISAERTVSLVSPALKAFCPEVVVVVVMIICDDW